jgi:hypothetical protein
VVSDAFWQALRAEMRAEIVSLRERLTDADDENWRLLDQLAERDATIRDLMDELAECRSRHPANRGL